MEKEKLRIEHSNWNGVTKIKIPIHSNGIYLLFAFISGDIISKFRVDKLKYVWVVYLENYYNIEKVISHLETFLVEEKH